MSRICGHICAKTDFSLTRFLALRFHRDKALSTPPGLTLGLLDGEDGAAAEDVAAAEDGAPAAGPLYFWGSKVLLRFLSVAFAS